MKRRTQGLEKAFNSDKDNKIVNESLIKEQPDAKTLRNKKYRKSNLIYNKFSFHSYRNDKKFGSIYFTSKDL